MDYKRKKQRKIPIYHGTNKPAFFRAGREGKSSEERKELYAKYARDEEFKIKPPYRPKAKPFGPFVSNQSTKIKKLIRREAQKNFPKSIKHFHYRQPLFFKSKLPKKVSNQLQRYFVAKLTDTAEKALILAVKCALANYLPIGLFEKLATAREIFKKIEAYIKVGQKIYKIVANISKSVQENQVEIGTSFSDNNYLYEDYVQFYKSNLSKIRQMPEQINNEIEEQINNETATSNEISVEEKIEIENKKQ